MDFERDKHNRNIYTKSLCDDCKKYKYYQVTLVMTDGSTFDGIIENIDDDNVTLLIAEDVTDLEDEKQPNHRQRLNGSGRRFRRYRHRNLPLNNLAQLALLSYIIPPVYPYYPYYPY